MCMNLAGEVFVGGSPEIGDDGVVDGPHEGIIDVIRYCTLALLSVKREERL